MRFSGKPFLRTAYTYIGPTYIRNIWLGPKLVRPILDLGPSPIHISIVIDSPFFGRMKKIKKSTISFRFCIVCAHRYHLQYALPRFTNDPRHIGAIYDNIFDNMQRILIGMHYTERRRATIGIGDPKWDNHAGIDVAGCKGLAIGKFFE